MMHRAVFLDRDGTLIEQVHHLVDPSKVRLIPGAAHAIRRVQEHGFKVFVITNQSVIGRGLLDEPGLDRVHAEMNRQLAEFDALVDGIYFCPVAPRASGQRTIEHPDRKPGPGMLLRAATEHNLDLTRSWMVGDMISDLLAGRNAGVRGTIGVKTGYGGGLDPSEPAMDAHVEDLPAAIDYILLATNTQLETHRIH